MYYNIEFIGAPGSGKTYIYKKILNYFKKKKIIIKNSKEQFFEYYLTFNTNISYIRKAAYYYYFKRVHFKSNFLFKKEYINLNNFLNFQIKKDKKFKKILNIYSKYLKTTIYTKERKYRMLKNFQIDYFGCKFNSLSKNYLLLDEGFYQKVYLNFYNKKYKISKKLLEKYLKFIPKPSLIFYIKTDIKKCFKRIENRKEGFLYNINKNYYLNKKLFFNDFLVNHAKIENIKIVKIDNNKFNSKNFYKIIKILKNKIK
jgi:hypothetical protein